MSIYKPKGMALQPNVCSSAYCVAMAVNPGRVRSMSRARQLFENQGRIPLALESLLADSFPSGQQLSGL
jgi:hypothetical protein